MTSAALALPSKAPARRYLPSCVAQTLPESLVLILVRVNTVGDTESIPLASCMVSRLTLTLSSSLLCRPGCTT